MVPLSAERQFAAATSIWNILHVTIVQWLEHQPLLPLVAEAFCSAAVRGWKIILCSY
jgi:hypothetical protein